MNRTVTNSAIPFVCTGSYPVRSGNLIRPLIDGEPAFRRICEAVEVAGHSVWVTVTFLWANFEMPDGRGSVFDVLDRATRRGVDVRLICWRPGEETARLRQNAFWGSDGNFDLLNKRGSDIKIRWDLAHPGFCQHQKSWLVDAGFENEVAFVGGINLNPHSVAAPGHYGEGQNHDVYVELTGPSTVDIHHNFVQRWNEASERHSPDGTWGAGKETELSFPNQVPELRGNALAQVQRTIHKDRYLNGYAAPGGLPYPIAKGEQSNFEQYVTAIDAARRLIYIENQQIDVPEILDCLYNALKRGVNMILLMPLELQDTRLKIPSEFLTFPNFLLAGIAGMGTDGLRKSVYIHAKLMLIDDEWATVGSCNLHRFSLFGNGEMNVAFSDPFAVKAFRCELFREHLDSDTTELDDRKAFQLFREIAEANNCKLKAGDQTWQGLAFTQNI